RGAYDALLCQSSLLVGENLERVDIMINYDMFDRPQTYEHTTQFHKQAPGLHRTIVNLLTSRELGYLGPIKAQCLIDFVETPLPGEDEVMSLCARRIVTAINCEAQEIELGQCEILAQKIFEDRASCITALAFLLRNYLGQQSGFKKTQGEPGESQRRPHRLPMDKRRPDRRDKRTESLGPSSEERPEASYEHKNQKPAPLEGVSRLYITLGKRDGFVDLASLAQYLSEKSGVDLGHFSGSGMVRDHSAHVEVDEDVAETIINALHNSERPKTKELEGEEAQSPVICEKARGMAPRPYRRPAPQRRRSNYSRH
ncbi:MAG TPA: hypothetical protein VEL47_02790, partial [Myxococcota bacterium]|nr:hypothetical protein [Myxococcota bacterium]